MQASNGEYRTKICDIAAILAVGYLRLQVDQDKSSSGAKLQTRKPVLSTCYSRPPEA